MSNQTRIYKKLSKAPDWIGDRTRPLLEDGEKVRLCFESDMTIAGNYGLEAIVVTDQRAIAVSADDEGVQRHVPLGELAFVRTKHYMGNGVLLLTTWNENVDILRYSSSLGNEVEEFKEELQQYLMSRLAWDEPDEHEEKVEHRDDEEPAAELSDRAERCPKCGNLLPRDRKLCNACINRTTVMRRMLAYLAPYKPQTVVCIVLSFILAALSATLPRLGRTLIDGAVAEQNMDLLRLLLAGLAALFLTRAVVAAIRKIFLIRLAQNIIYDLRRQVYSHLQMLSMSFHDKQSTGRLISRVVTDTSRLQQFAVGQVQQFLVDILMLIIVLGWMMSFSVKLTVLLWLPLPVYYFLVRWYRENVHKVLRKAFRKRAAMSGHLSDTIPGIAMVKGFSQEHRSIDEFNRHSNDFRTETVRAVHFSAKFTAAFLILTQIGILMVYWFGGKAAILGNGFTLGDLVMFLGWTGLMYQPVNRFAKLTEQFENAATSAERVFDVLDTEAVIDRNPDGHKLEEIQEGMRFENVSFNYECGPAVLRNVSFKVNAGETVGVVGPSGSGKSTLIKLISRFYDVSGGRILIDGHDLRDLNLEHFRKHIAIVGQSPFLFRTSILENIRYGRPDASREEVLEAARVANAHRFIMNFPEAYDTDARERGTRFSGGERQRICIARAVLKDPNILILDEATSSVDTHNEKLIQEALDRLIENRTTFIIAHRLSTLRNADKIVMMKDGEVLDVAPHTRLMKRCVDYRQLVEAQSDLDGDVEPRMA